MDVSLNRRPAWRHRRLFQFRIICFFRARLMFLIPRRATLAVRHFTVLAFESSADDTCAAVVTSSRKILSNVVVKQNHL